VLFARRGVICVGKYPDIGGKVIITPMRSSQRISPASVIQTANEFRLDHEGNLVPPVD
jgi:hypothetical protein